MLVHIIHTTFGVLIFVSPLGILPLHRVTGACLVTSDVIIRVYVTETRREERRKKKARERRGEEMGGGVILVADPRIGQKTILGTWRLRLAYIRSS